MVISASGITILRLAGLSHWIGGHIYLMMSDYSVTQSIYPGIIISWNILRRWQRYPKI